MRSWWFRSSQKAQNGISLQVTKGYGLPINFQQTGEQITQSWLSDPSGIVFKVQNGVVFIRRIKPITFPNITRNKDGSTQFIVLTTSNQGQKQYTFKLIPTETNPEYTSVVLVPNSNNQPFFDAPRTYSTKPTHLESVDFANGI